MRTEVMSIRQTDGGAQATLKIDFGRLDMEVFNRVATFADVTKPFDDEEVLRICSEMVRSSFVGGWATFLAYGLAQDADVQRRMSIDAARGGPDDAVLQG